VVWRGGLHDHDGSSGRVADIDPDEAAYYAAQPLWLVVTTDIALVAAVAAAVALLLRSRVAVLSFGTSLAVVLLNNAYDIGAGMSRVFVDRGALAMTSVIVLYAILLLVYAMAMKRRAVLK
jgi:hypothetical protein